MPNPKWATIAILIMILLVACTARENWEQELGSWDQYLGDAANSGQKFVATPIPVAGQQAVLGLSSVTDVIRTTPTVAPDGQVIFSSYAYAASVPEGRTSRFYILYKGPQPAIRRARIFAGQMSTAAVDAGGNIYAVLDEPGDGNWQLVSWTSGGNERWRMPFRPNGWTLAPPKLVAHHAGGTLIFVAGGFGSLIVFNDKGVRLREEMACYIVEGGTKFPFEFKVQPLARQPLLENPAPAIILAPIANPDRFFIVAPFNRCGIAFIEMYLGRTSDHAPFLRTFRVVEADKQFSSPAISPNGIAVIGNSQKSVEGYDVRTGHWKWGVLTDKEGEISQPALLPLGLNFAYFAAGDKVRKIDISDGSVVGQLEISGAKSISASASRLHVTATGALHLLNFDLRLEDTVPLSLGGPAATFGIKGEVYVVEDPARLTIFPGQ